MPRTHNLLYQDGWLENELKAKTVLTIAREQQCTPSNIHYALKKLAITKTVQSRWFNGVKNEIRSEVCQKNRNKVYRRVLLLPSNTCLDVKELLLKKAIDSTTEIVAIERDPAIVPELTENLTKLGFNNFIVVQSELEFSNLDGQFDFVFLDLCGQLSPGVVNWLCTQVQKKIFADDCKIAIAVSHYCREGHKFYLKLKKTFNGKKIVKFSTAGGFSDIQKEQHNVIALILTAIFGEFNRNWMYKSEGKAATMHVFSFTARPRNLGLLKVIQFLERETNRIPEKITPGIKAALTKQQNRQSVPETPDKLTTVLEDLVCQVKNQQQQINELAVVLLQFVTANTNFKMKNTEKECELKQTVI